MSAFDTAQILDQTEAPPRLSADLSEDPVHQRRVTELAAHYFGIEPELVVAPGTGWYVDDSGAFSSYACPVPRHAELSPGHASRIDVAVQRSQGLTPSTGIEAVREEHDHPAVDVVEVDAPEWTLGYSVSTLPGAAVADSALTRFVQVDELATLSVTFDAYASYLDLAAAVSLAADIREAIGWDRRVAPSSG